MALTRQIATSKIVLKNQHFLPKWHPCFDFFGGPNSLTFLKVVFEFFKKSVGIVFGIKRPPYVCIFSSKSYFQPGKIVFLSKFVLTSDISGVIFEEYAGQKNQFVYIFEVV